MKKPGLSAATEAAAAVTVATAQREVQPAVTDSQKVVSCCPFTSLAILLLTFRMNTHSQLLF